MRVTVTGATGRVGGALVGALLARGDDVTVLSRSPEQAQSVLGVQAVGWDPAEGPAPSAGLEGRDARGAPGGRGRRPALERRRQAPDPRLARDGHPQPRGRGCATRDPRPRVLVSASAVGYYGPRGDEELAEDDRRRQRLPRPGRHGLGARGRPRRRRSACASSSAHRRRARRGAAAR